MPNSGGQFVNLPETDNISNIKARIKTFTLSESLTFYERSPFIISLKLSFLY